MNSPMLFNANLPLPNSTTLLEEINLPPEIVSAVMGTTVTVQVLSQELAQARQLTEPDDYPCLIDEDGKIWNDFRPVRVLFTDQQGRAWRIPRFWLDGVPEAPKALSVEGTITTENLSLPTEWDLGDINITSLSARRAAGHPSSVVVETSPDGSTKVHWCDPEGVTWRIPHDWRRRRIKLPDSHTLASQGVHDEVAKDFAGRVVTVNYHPGSLCCLPEQYRFRDGRGGKWWVRINDCTVVGFENG